MSGVFAGVVLSVVGFFCGSVMFADLLVRLRGEDIRRFGDGNPGAVNAFKAGGAWIGTLALLLDFLKGAVPVALGYWFFGVAGWWLVPLLVAPLLGHMFSPWLGFRGGKGIAVTFGVWSGLTLWEAPVVMGLALVLGKFVLKFRNDAVSVLLAVNLLIVYAGLRYSGEPVLVAAVLNAVLLLWRHRQELLRR